MQESIFRLEMNSLSLNCGVAYHVLSLVTVLAPTPSELNHSVTTSATEFSATVRVRMFRIQFCPLVKHLQMRIHK